MVFYLGLVVLFTECLEYIVLPGLAQDHLVLILGRLLGHLINRFVTQGILVGVIDLLQADLGWQSIHTPVYLQTLLAFPTLFSGGLFVMLIFVRKHHPVVLHD